MTWRQQMNFRKQVAEYIYPEAFIENERMTELIKFWMDKFNNVNKKLIECKKFSGISDIPNRIERSISSLGCRQVIFNTLDIRSANVYVLDREYRIPAEESWNLFLRVDDLQSNEYVVNSYDCDNFSFTLCERTKRWLPGCSTGVVMDRKHAWAFIILQNKDGSYIEFIEPQTDMKLNRSSDNLVLIMW
jgi:hypothetical protein